MNSESPCVLATKLASSKSKAKGAKGNTIEEDTFVVETILAIKDDQYHIKWLNYPESEATWEPDYNILKLIRKYFDVDPKHCGGPLPPFIEETTDLGKTHIKKWFI